MKYLVTVHAAEFLFPDNDQGFRAAVEMAVASKRNVYRDHPRKIVWKYSGKSTPLSKYEYQH